MTKADVLTECLKSNPSTPTRTLAKTLVRKHPKLFPDIEKARNAIRYRRGQKGKMMRSHLADKRTIRKKGSQKDRPSEQEAAVAAGPEPLENTLLRMLEKNLRKHQSISILELSDKLDRSQSSIEAALGTLRGQGYNLVTNQEEELELSSHLPKQEAVKISTKDYFGGDWIRFGLVADTHLVSKYAREDVLDALYDVFAREGLKKVYHCGNWIDGEARFNKYDIHCIGVENQVDYFLKHYPARKGITTEIISGDDHEGWYVQGNQINIGKVMQDRAEAVGRHDLKDLGYMERDLVFHPEEGSPNSSTVRVIHAGGGSAYALSYTSQKYVESLQGGEKPAMVLVGHYHKFDWNYAREVNIIQAGCVQDQTPFMRKKRIQAMVGGCIVEIKQDSNGCFVRTKVEWMPFYDRRYYQYKWN